MWCGLAHHAKSLKQCHNLPQFSPSIVASLTWKCLSKQSYPSSLQPRRLLTRLIPTGDRQSLTPPTRMPILPPTRIAIKVISTLLPAHVSATTSSTTGPLSGAPLITQGLSCQMASTAPPASATRIAVTWGDALRTE